MLFKNEQQAEKQYQQMKQPFIMKTRLRQYFMYALFGRISPLPSN